MEFGLTLVNNCTLSRRKYKLCGACFWVCISNNARFCGVKKVEALLLLLAPLVRVVHWCSKSAARATDNELEVVACCTASILDWVRGNCVVASTSGEQSKQSGGVVEWCVEQITLAATSIPFGGRGWWLGFFLKAPPALSPPPPDHLSPHFRSLRHFYHTRVCALSALPPPWIRVELSNALFHLHT